MYFKGRGGGCISFQHLRSTTGSLFEAKYRMSHNNARTRKTRIKFTPVRRYRSGNWESAFDESKEAKP